MASAETVSDARELKQQSVARSLLMALMAENQASNRDLRDFCAMALGLRSQDVTLQTWEVVDRGRGNYGMTGVVPAAGAFPLTPYEYDVQTQLVQLAAAEHDELKEISRSAPAI